MNTRGSMVSILILSMVLPAMIVQARVVPTDAKPAVLGDLAGVADFQDPIPDDGTWRTYTCANTVYALAEDGDHVWAGTTGGVVRWNRADGSYTKYTTADGLVSNTVNAVAVDHEGHKWFGTAKGLSEYDGSSWTTYTTQDGLVSNSVYAIATDDSGHKWFGTSGGVSEYDGSSWTSYTTEDGLAYNYVSAIAIDGSGHKWFGTRLGVSKFDGTSWTTYTSPSVYAIAIGEQGCLWFGTAWGVWEFDGSTWTTYTTADGLAGNRVFAIAIDGAGHKWFATDTGVSEFDGNNWATYTPADGLAGYDTRAVAVDRAEHKWFGTIDGVSEFSGGAWTAHTTADGLASNLVDAVAIDGSGHKWFGTSAGVSEFDGSSWTTYTTEDGLVFDQVRSIAEDHQGHKWFATHYGVSEFDGSIWTTYTTADGLASNRVYAVAIDHAGHKWFGTDDGVSEFDGSTWTTYSMAHDLGNTVLAIAVDGMGHMWFGTDGGGVTKYDGTSWTNYTTADGLVSSPVNAITIDHLGRMWFATYQGLSEFDGNDWITYTTYDGLNNASVHAVAVDVAGYKWFGTSEGATEFDSNTWTWSTYTTADGLVGNRINSIAIDDNGHKWFATSEGISEFIPAEVTLTVVPTVGASLTYTNTQGSSANLEAPAGAVTETMVLLYTPLESISEPFGVSFAVLAFRLEAYRNGVSRPSLTFSNPVTVTLYYTNDDLAGLDKDALELRRWYGNRWSGDGITLVEHNTAQNHLVVTITQVGEFALVVVEDMHHTHLPIIRHDYDWTTISQWTQWAFSGEQVSDLNAGPEPGLLWATVDDTLYRSADHGRTWDPLASGLPPGAHSVTVADGPGLASPVYVAAGWHKIFASQDGGARWRLDTELPSSVSYLDLVDDVPYAVTGEWGDYHVFRRLQTGRWEAVGNELHEVVYDIAAHQSTVYLGTSQGLYRLVESEWEPVTLATYSASYYDLTDWLEPGLAPRPLPQAESVNSTIGVRSIVVVDGGIYVGTTGGRGVYRSADGVTWRACDVGLTGPYGHSVYELAASGSGRLFAATNDGVFVSENQGERWQALDAGLLHTITGYGVLLDQVTATSLTLLRDQGADQTLAAVFDGEGVRYLTVTDHALFEDPPPRNPPKAVLVVGPLDPPDHSWTRSLIAWADRLAQMMKRNGMEVVKVYWPDSTWENVRPALSGASIIVYKGHGFGLGELPEDPTDMVGGLNGFCLVDPTDPPGARLGTQDMLIATNRLAENAVAFMFCCYCAGGSSGDPAPVSEALARRRIEAYASTFIRMGASGYFASVSEESLLEDLFSNPNKSLGDLYQSWGGNPQHTYPHILWPDVAVWFDGDTERSWTRAFVGDPNLTAAEVLGR